MHHSIFYKRKTADRDTYLLQTLSNEHQVDGTESKLCDDEKEIHNMTERGETASMTRKDFYT